MAATTLLSTAITSAASNQVSSVFSGFSGAQAVSLQAKFAAVTPGTSVDAYVQTSLDSGLSWCDVAEFSFTTASATKVANLSAMVAIATATAITDGALAANATLQGLIGELWRVRWTSVGTYGAGTTLTIVMQPR